MSVRTIHVAHSPDSDDAFMFYALAEGKIPWEGYEFVHHLHDIETLNQAAREGRFEVTAISIHAYAHVADRYRLLGSGASMGDGYGPLVVAAEPRKLEEFSGERIAVPGPWTSAYLALRLRLPEFEPVHLPFDRIGEAVRRGEVAAGVLIHEGQLTYAREGLVAVEDLGAWWKEKTGLPLPLGGNAVRRDLEPAVQRDLARLVRASVRYALEHRREALEHALAYGRGLAPDEGDRFVSMYVNEWTLDYGEAGRRALQLFLDAGYQAGALDRRVAVDLLD